MSAETKAKLDAAIADIKASNAKYAVFDDLMDEEIDSHEDSVHDLLWAHYANVL